MIKQNTFLAMAKTDFAPFNPWSLAVGHCVRHDVYFENDCTQCEDERADLEEFKKLCASADYDSSDVSKGDK